ncbi:hypothetical protein H920_17189 [Fukomys damarensis]|uniref:Uncharacterized protein n=1 Tax=Fukomys damarensis TaxID=885580 RepID=A0A091CUN7_FUKDA|nr:hypothetical protein H920_17189 [Fukomys damarensis]
MLSRRQEVPGEETQLELAAAKKPEVRNKQWGPLSPDTHTEVQEGLAQSSSQQPCQDHGGHARNTEMDEAEEFMRDQQELAEISAAVSTPAESERRLARMSS